MILRQFDFRTIDNRCDNRLKAPRKAVVVAIDRETAEAELKVNRTTKHRKWGFFAEKTLNDSANVIAIFAQQGDRP